MGVDESFTFCAEQVDAMWAVVRAPYPPFGRCAPPRTRPQTLSQTGFFFMHGQRGLQSRATQNGRVTGQMFIDGKPGSKAVLATFKRGAVQLP